MSVKIFNYLGSQITFNDGETVWVLATEMAKAFGKQPNDYLRLDSTKDFIAAYMEENPTTGNPVVVQNGGQNRGTWMSVDLALHFAQWLSPKFAVWCNKMIKQLLTTGTASLSLDSFAAMLKTGKGIIAIGQRMEELEGENTQLKEVVESLAPDAAYTRTVLKTENLHTATVVAAGLNMSATKMNALLVQRGIMYKQNGVYVLYSKYKDMGLVGYRVHTRLNSIGETVTESHMYWNERGRSFINSLLNPSTQISTASNVRPAVSTINT